MSARLWAAVLGSALAAAPGWARECVVGGTCVAGICVGGTSQSCAEDDDPCTVTTCDPIRGCVVVPASGITCDDGDACTSGDRCVVGRCVGEPIRCGPDAHACTDEVCVAGACQIVPVDARCPADECNTGICRPGRGCVTTARPDGEACADDGAACTDDVCDTGSCLHVPIDARCGLPETCDVSVCAPERGGADAAGCAPAEPAGGAGCAEDGDACSDDECAVERCEHTLVADVARCAPIRPAFRRALGLAALARALAAREGSAPAVLRRRLEAIDADLRAAAAILAGRSAPAPDDSAGPAETVAQARARGALAAMDKTSGQARAVVRAAQRPALRAALGRPRCAALRRDVRTLLRGTRALAAALTNVREVTGTFVRRRLPERAPR